MKKVVSASKHERCALDNDDDDDAVLESLEPGEAREGRSMSRCISNEDVKCFSFNVIFNYSGRTHARC
jgi:hypothetical protein